MRLVIGPALLGFIVLVLPFVTLTPAHAGWSSNPVTVRGTTASIPAVVSCNDGAFGTFVAWQEEATAGSGELRIQHLLPTGDLDPAWPATGALASDVVGPRTLLGSMPDGLGGVYVWWWEGTTLYLNRLEVGGAVASGWPTRGKSLGNVSTIFRPSIIDDGAHGLYVASSSNGVRGYHLGPNGLGAGGWPTAGRILVPPDDPPVTLQLWPDLALAPGGVFLTWGVWSSDTTLIESHFYMRRLTSAGLSASGWEEGALVFGAFRPENAFNNNTYNLAPVLDIAPDGRGGVFVFWGLLYGDYDPYVDSRLYRWMGDGQSASDWPEEGVPIELGGLMYAGSFSTGHDSGLRVHFDGIDGAVVEYPHWFGTHMPAMIGISRVPNPSTVHSPVPAVVRGHETVVRDGRFQVADFKWVGPSSPFDWGAFLGVTSSPSSPWPDPLEYHNEPLQEWYGDIGLASTGDGGVVLAWSQKKERFGLFARRFNPTGEVTGVTSSRTPVALRGLKFVDGKGVVARLALDGTKGRFELFDLTGRRVASSAIHGSGEVDIELSGTSSLASGVYFGRLTSGAVAASGRVAIAR